MHARFARILFSAVCLLAASTASLSAADLAVGADSVADLYSPSFIGGGAFSTSTGSAQAAAVNPAATGEEQRVILDASYAALAGLGSESGVGHALNLGGVFPTKYASFAGSLRFLTSPFSSFPVGTAVGLKGSASKELYPGFSAGVGLGAAFGSDWSLGLDLGVRQRLGTIAFMKNFSWAFAFQSLGKGWAPSAFTPTLGAGFDLVSVDQFRLRLLADLGSPSFSNLTGRFGVDANIARWISLSSSVGFNLREAIDGKAASAIPSFGLTLNFVLAGKKEGKEPSIFDDGELATCVAIKPMYNGVLAFGAGATAVLGVADKTPPAISIDYPKPVWISPNNDGKVDALEFPVSIADSRYVAEWQFIVKNDKGEIVRVVKNKERRPENEGLRDFLSRVTDVKSGVEVPKTMRWDGNADSGALAPDGKYLFHIEAKDDNGNAAVSKDYEVYIDTTPPSVTVDQSPTAAARIFSPDGDGSKDTIAVKQTGSVEDSWKAVIVDAAGTAVRTFPIANAAPADLSWDGKDDSGKVVPDSVYRYEISAVDRAQNEGRAAFENIIVNTERPPVNLMIDEAYFSPNGDGVKDTLSLSPGVPVKDGLVSWTIEVQDKAGAVVRTFTGSSPVPAKMEFDGKGDDGKAVAEGGYQGAFVARYQNGYEAKARSPLFTIDVTAPSVTVLKPGSEAMRTFSPDGDGSKDTYTIAQSGSREELWTAKIADAAGKTVRTKTWEGVEPADFVWDGKDDSGRPVSDGTYRYAIASQDLAGNKASAGSDAIIIDRSKPAVSATITNPFYSPNGDGISDEIAVSLSAQSSAAAESWKAELVEAAQAATAAGKKTFQGTGAPPERASFGGADDQGKAIAEGEYRARLSVSYRNGYNAAVLSPSFFLDLTPPSATVSADYPGFSPNGDNNLDSMAFTQKGSDEIAWNGVISKDGKTVKNIAFEGAPPAKFEWDGLNADGKLAPDGSYEYRLYSMDRAGNKGSSAAVPFQLSTANTPLLLVADQKAFSPNGDGSKDTIAITPQPQVKDGIDSWKVDVLDAAGAVVRTFQGKGAPEAVVWNGKDAKGAAVKDGAYTARAEIRYTLGNRPTASTAPFAVDTAGPSIALTVADKVFSPNGDGSKDTLAISRVSSDDEWTLSVVSAQAPNVPLRKWTWKGQGGDLVWGGKDDAGNIVGDGRYSLVAEARDAAGNYKKATLDGIVVNTQAPEIELSAPSTAFSPNGDGRSDTLAIQQKTEGDNAWEGSIVSADGSVVKTWTWKGAAKNIVWDGKDAKGAASKDGVYHYVAKSIDAAGNKTEKSIDNLILDTVPPALELSFPYTLFSPNGDGRKDELTPAIKTDGDDEWEAAVDGKAGAVQASWKWKGAAPAIAWNGRDAAGNTAADGTYRFTVKSEDAAGNRTERSIDGIAIDNRPTRVFATASAQGLSPNGDGAFDTIRFGLIVNLKEGIENWRLDIVDEAGKVRRSLGSADASGTSPTNVPDAVVWNGMDTDGSARDGKLTAKLSVFYSKGDLAAATAGPFVLDITPPELKLSSSPQWFSPDNDGVEDELSIAISAKDASAIDSWSLEIKEPQPPAEVFYKAEGKGAPSPKLVWDGRSNKGELVQAATDYPAALTVKDAWGNVGTIAATIGVDVLVIREGDILRIKVPSIIFRENADDFNGLAKDAVDNNLRVLKRIAQILNKFRDYKVKVEGHANPVVRTAAEEKNELQPLSEKRARAVLNKLVEFGVDAPRLSSFGMGGSRAVVKWEDRANWWKNRRVEFILVK